MKADPTRAARLTLALQKPMNQDQARAQVTFENLFEQHWARVHAVAARFTGDADAAEDLALEAFQRLYEHLGRRGDAGNPGGWLYRTVTNLGLNALRQTARRRRYEEEAGRQALALASGEPDPVEAVESREDAAQVRAILAAMKPGHARLLVLRSLGFSYREIAEACRVKVGSVGTLLNRAEQEFEKRYRARFGDER